MHIAPPLKRSYFLALFFLFLFFFFNCLFSRSVVSLTFGILWVQYHELAAEAYYLMAIVYDKLGHIDEREEAAASFQKHILALENPQDKDDDPLYDIETSVYVNYQTRSFVA